MHRRTLLAATASTLSPLAAPVLRAQGFPARPIQVLIGWPPGGGVDVMGRAMAEAMAAELGSPVVVENRAGAAGVIATLAAARAAGRLRLTEEEALARGERGLRIHRWPLSENDRAVAEGRPEGLVKLVATARGRLLGAGILWVGWAGFNAGSALAANGLAAAYLAERNVPAIYRCQAECRPETDRVQSDYPIFHIYRQRRLFARVELETRPGPHCSLGMNPYTTVTSPIRRYIDLVVQRQIKRHLCEGLQAYTREALERILTHVRVQLGKIAFVHRKWTRYWILRYLEQEDIQTLHGIVLDKNNKFAYLLLPDFLMEVHAPLSPDHTVGAGEMVRLKIERLNPRDDLLRVQIV